MSTPRTSWCLVPVVPAAAPAAARYQPQRRCQRRNRDSFSQIAEEDEVLVEVFGPEPPCPRCIKTLETVKQAIKEMQLKCEVRKVDAYSKSAVAKYGLVFTPAVAVDGRVFVAGRIPSADEVKRILRVTANTTERKQNGSG